jgi:hypothetical protein
MMHSPYLIIGLHYSSVNMNALRVPVDGFKGKIRSGQEAGIMFKWLISRVIRERAWRDSNPRPAAEKAALLPSQLTYDD